jgi:class 3 adenylate cyclase/tetratricopeptide (TPR) repeat protein
MRCAKCGSDNRDGRKFCAKCGAVLARSCPRCGASNEPGEDFCGECGTSLQAATVMGQEPPAASPLRTTTETSRAPDGERRHLTVLFCDLVDSTALASQMDPEDWRAAVAAYHRAAAEAITRFGGHVAKYLGDGVMAFFGYPEAHDNDAERAARAGLGILEAIAKLNEEAAHPKLAARVGVDSGPVVVGAGAGKDADVFGDTPNIAARVQAAAEPGTVLVSANTHRLISGMFVVEDCGAQVLKGLEQPLQLYRVLRPSGVRGRLEAAASSRGLTPFVGREDELRLLMSGWARSRAGEGQVALIIGEAGIGKSRLVHRFHEAIAEAPHTWIEAGASAFFQNTPFYPVTEMLRQFLGNSPAEDQITQLEPRLIAAGLKPAEALPLIAPLLNLPLPTDYPPSPLPPDQQRRRLLATLVEWVLGSARAQPLVIATEDLHWADPSTLELIQLLVEQGARASLLLVYTARPEFRPPWPLRAHHTQVTLNRLGEREIRAMVAQVVASKALADETVTAVVERTGGVPLFVEELTRSLLESGAAKPADRAIPATLHDSLMARLDTLGPAKEAAQVASVIGRAFSYELLHAVSPIPEDELQSALKKLADAELIYVRGIAPEATYQFKHALIQDAAYEALLKSRRKELHRRVARTISEVFPAMAEAQPEVLARHWTGAGEAEPAIEAWKKAGEAADARGALKEAEEGCRQALAILNNLPESPERDARELALVTRLIWLLQRSKGHAAAETIEAVEQARSLAEKTGNLPQLVLQVIGSYAAVFVTGDYSSAAALADQALDLAQREGSHNSLVFAHGAQVNVRFNRGDLVGLERHFACLRSLVEASDRSQLAESIAYGIIIALGYASLGAWMLGYAEKARSRIVLAIAFARDYKNPFVLASGRTMESYLYRWFREPQRVADAAAETVAISEEHNFPYLKGTRVTLGWARAQLGNPDEGVALIRQGLAALAETGGRTDITNALTILAEAQALDGAIDDALTTLDEALQANPEELVFRPNILKWRGELRFKRGQNELAEADFREAIRLARQMSAKSWELRATTSLARLLNEQSHRDEARAMLAEIYNWFTEGFDTADLKDAKMLLAELSA